MRFALLAASLLALGIGIELNQPLLSLLAFGGGAAVLPDMQRQAVEVHHWLTSREFLDMFALSRAIPPGSMIVVLVGQKAAGIAGGLVALLAMFGPSSLLAYALARLWHRAGGAAWRETVEQGSQAG